MVLLLVLFNSLPLLLMGEPFGDVAEDGVHRLHDAERHRIRVRVRRHMMRGLDDEYIGSALDQYWLAGREPSEYAANRSILTMFQPRVLGKVRQNVTDILPAIRHDTQAAVRSWVAGNHQLTPFQPDSVVMHFRCGDVIKEGGDGAGETPEYGSLSFAWYAQQVPETASEILIVGNATAGLEAGRLRSQTHHGPPHGTNAVADDVGAGSSRCGFLLERLVVYLEQRTSKPVHLVSRGGDEDFALLVNAPTMIGSASKYAMWAGIANGNGHVILPDCEEAAAASGSGGLKGDKGDEDGKGEGKGEGGGQDGAGEGEAAAESRRPAIPGVTFAAVQAVLHGGGGDDLGGRPAQIQTLLLMEPGVSPSSEAGVAGTKKAALSAALTVSSLHGRPPCPKRNYQSAAATQSSVHVCSPLTDCAGTQWASTPPSAYSDRGCSALTVCKAGEVEMYAPTATTDRSCQVPVTSPHCVWEVGTPYCKTTRLPILLQPGRIQPPALRGLLPRRLKSGSPPSRGQEVDLWYSCPAGTTQTGGSRFSPLHGPLCRLL
jgi:hypothetical protein